MSFLPDDYDSQDFEIESEGWSLYKVEDGTFIRIRIILAGVSKAQPNPQNPEQLGYKFDLLPPAIFAITRPDDRGPPSTSPATRQDIIHEDMKFTPIQEPWNVYRLKDGTKLSTRILATMISKTNKFTPDGVRIYFVDNQPQIKAVLPPELKKKQVVFIPPKPTVTVWTFTIVLAFEEYAC